MKRSEDSHASFPSTHWSLIQRAAHDRGALAEFVRAYWQPMRHFLIRLRVPPSQAEDVVQEFLVDKLLNGKLLERADGTVGRFRPFLKQALRNFAIDWYRGSRHQQATVSLAGPAIPDPPEEQEAVDIFDLEWARRVVARTVQRMRGGCAVQQWQVFVGRLWAPLTRGAATVPYEELQRQLGFGNTKEVANVLVNARKRFAVVLREVVGEYTATEAEIREELTELRRVLLSRSAMEWRHLLGSAAEMATASSLVPCGTGEAAEAAPPASDESLDAVDSSSLATALQIDVDMGGNAEDQAAILEFYLSTAVADLPGMADARGRHPRVDRTPAEAPLTLGDLLQQSPPALELLQQVKRAARRESTRKDATMPRRIAEAIYFSSIAVALVQCGACISSSPPNVLRSGCDMLLGCDWLPSWQRQTLLDARQGLGSHG